MILSSQAEIRDCVTPLTLPPLLPAPHHGPMLERRSSPTYTHMPQAAYEVQTAQEHEVWMGGGSGVGVGGWNSDNLTYQGWTISGLP